MFRVSQQRLLPTATLSEGLPEYFGASVFVDVESADRVVLNKVSSVLVSTTTPFQEVGIFRTPNLGLVLTLDGIIQLAELDEHIYHELLVHPAALTLSEMKSVLILGGGDGCATRELLKYRELERLEVVEIDRQVVDLCREHLNSINLGALDDPRVTLIVQEGESYLNEHPEKRYDLVLADLTEPYDTAGSSGDLSKNIFSTRFYARLKRHMTPGGILAAQSGGVTCTPKVDIFHRSIVDGLRECFASVHTAYEYLRSYDQVWTITLASDHYYDIPGLDPDPLLESRGIADLRHYDTISHRRAFSPPRHLRQSIAGR
ncbi:MAG: hypothetical protein LDL33_15665 [Desulfomonile sp.]|nr:hypothetical protein [Desulfomonile sp.]